MQAGSSPARSFAVQTSGLCHPSPAGAIVSSSLHCVFHCVKSYVGLKGLRSFDRVGISEPPGICGFSGVFFVSISSVCLSTPYRRLFTSSDLKKSKLDLRFRVLFQIEYNYKVVGD